MQEQPKHMKMEETHYGSRMKHVLLLASSMKNYCLFSLWSWMKPALSVLIIMK